MLIQLTSNHPQRVKVTYKSEDQTKTKKANVPLNIMNDASEIEAKELKLEYFKSRMKANCFAE